jgi:DNA mismatch repair protein MSH6
MLMEEFAADPAIAMYHMACQVDSKQKDVTFFYKFLPGACPKSHGMNVATMAGLPVHVVDKAREMSAEFEARVEAAHKSAMQSESVEDRLIAWLQSVSATDSSPEESIQALLRVL